ncbi:hypothetical protein CJ030_MR5G023950 [Morella rubra]|uniref:DUF455 domain-containing protein n=1 Tax=Morella rubra TaxID=262757 RepID=A0A6A1VKR1_9ROSI|nr:hypothetical protein CJ030_MR5G023950 [Morella rubra]
MVKTDSHTVKVKGRLLAEKKKIEEAEERRKAREAKRLSKEIQAQKLKERTKQKKDEIESVKKWRKQRQQSGFAEGERDAEMDLNFEDGKVFERSDKKRPGVAQGDSSGGKAKRGPINRKKQQKREQRSSKFGSGGSVSKLKSMLSPKLPLSSLSSHVPPFTFKPQSCASSLSSSPSYSSLPLQYPPWEGLQAWRESPLNEDRIWGPNGPAPLVRQPPTSAVDSCDAPIGSATSLAELGALVLSTSDPLTKSRLSHLAYSRWCRENLPLGVVSDPPSRPVRPPKPELVSPKEIPAPKDSGLPLNAYMLHNLAHVELNAIDLAWDTVVRFSPFSDTLGEGFFRDFAHVADDESRHFAWCSQRLSELGFKYGDMPAHNLLWRECEKSSDNVTARLAVIPLVQVAPKESMTSTLVRFPKGNFLPRMLSFMMVEEARGLDAGPRLVKRLIGFGDLKTSSIVARIAEEEVAHVAVGVYWFVSICQKMGCTPGSTFQEVLDEYNVELKGPFNYSARDEAGLPRDWYDGSSRKEHDNDEKQEKNEKLSMVYERLASIISMESQNSSLNRPPG